MKISQSVNGLTEVSTTYTPAAGKKVKARVFVANGNANKNWTATLYWKYGQAGQTTVWLIRQEAEMPFVFDVPEEDVDGVNRFGLVADNNEIGAQPLSAYARIEEN